MKKRGFTLVELMGILIILGVLSTILIPVISSTLKNQKQKQYDQQLQVMKLATKNFATDNMFILPATDGEKIYVNLKQLKSMGYVENRIINPLTKKEFSDCLVIEITRDGENYNYNILENTLESNSCNDKDSIINISNPSKQYLKKDNLTYYIITVKSIDETLFATYNLDHSKIEIIGAASSDAKYNIIGENGVYKLSITGGATEGDLSFKLNEGAISDEQGNNLIVDNNVYPTQVAYVDNTAPSIVFVTNGTSTYSKAVSTIINVEDEIGGDETTYKYIYSKTYINPNNSFTNGQEVSHSNGDGDYYVYAEACDKAGNCINSQSNAFKLDNSAPECGAWKGQNTSWTKNDITITMIPIDKLSGVKEGNQFTKTYNSGEIKNDHLSYTVEDNLGNKKVCVVDANVYFDKQAPSIPNIKATTSSGITYISDTWTKDSITMSYSSTDGGSQGIYYQYSNNNTNWNSSNSSNGFVSTNTSWTVSPSQSTDYYIRACDSLNNCSNASLVKIKVDKTAPTITTSLNCTPSDGKTQCINFIVNDNSKDILALDKSHCVVYEDIQSNSCSNGYTAVNRLNNYINMKYNNGSNKYPDDNKSATWASSYNGTSYTILRLDTSFSTTVQYAARVCDKAGNCTSINGTHNNQK